MYRYTSEDDKRMARLVKYQETNVSLGLFLVEKEDDEIEKQLFGLKFWLKEQITL